MTTSDKELDDNNKVETVQFKGLTLTVSSYSSNPFVFVKCYDKGYASLTLEGTTAVLCDIKTGGGQGVGSILLEFIIQYCRGKDYTTLEGSISSVDDTERLKIWYRRYGFEVTTSVKPDNVYDIKLVL